MGGTPSGELKALKGDTFLDKSALASVRKTNEALPHFFLSEDTFTELPKQSKRDMEEGEVKVLKKHKERRFIFHPTEIEATAVKLEGKSKMMKFGESYIPAGNAAWEPPRLINKYRTKKKSYLPTSYSEFRAWLVSPSVPKDIRIQITVHLLAMANELKIAKENPLSEFARELAASPKKAQTAYDTALAIERELGDLPKSNQGRTRGRLPEGEQRDESQKLVDNYGIKAAKTIASPDKLDDSELRAVVMLFSNTFPEMSSNAANEASTLLNSVTMLNKVDVSQNSYMSNSIALRRTLGRDSVED